MPETLIVSTTYVDTPEKQALFGLWLRALRAKHMAPGVDVLVIDSCSPLPLPLLPDGVRVHRFETDVGHPARSAQPSRDFLFGLSRACAGPYAYVVHLETDFLLAKPVAETVRKLARHDIPVAAPFEANQQFLESQAVFFSTKWLRETNFIPRYRVQYTPATVLSEILIERLAGDELFILPFRGLRNNFDLLTVGNFDFVFRHGCDWLSHCKDFAVYEKFMKVNGL